MLFTRSCVRLQLPVIHVLMSSSRVCAGAEAQVSHLKATVQEQKTKYTQLLNEKALGERDAAALLAAAENRAAELEAQMKAEQSKKEEYSNKLTFYGNAYQKLQGKLTGGRGSRTGFCKVLLP